MPCSFEILSQIVPFVEPFQLHSKNCIKSPAVLARGPLPLVLADARPPAVLAPAPDALVLAYSRSPVRAPSFGCCSGGLVDNRLGAPSLAGGPARSDKLGALS